MAYIEQKGPGYRITVSLGRNADGTKRVERTIFYPKATTPKAIDKEVEAFAYDFEARVKRGEYYSGEKITFRELIPIWFSQCAEKTVTLRVREDYQAKLNRYFTPVLGTMKLCDIRTVHIQNILADLEERGLCLKTIRNYFTPINSIFKFAFNQGLIKENPCLRCTLPKINPDGIVEEDHSGDKLQFFDVKQASCFLGFLDDGYEVSYPERKRTDRAGKAYTVAPYSFHRDISPQYIAYFYLAIYGGFRLGEMCALKWRDVDWENNLISIQKAVTKTKSKGQFLKCPKTKSSYRRVTLPQICFEKLQACKTAQLARMEELCSLWMGKRGSEYEDNYIFIKWKDGSRIHIDTPNKEFEKLIELYNSTHDEKLPRIRLHDLRHTSATLLLSENVNIETVCKRMGHGNASTTLNIYGHTMPVKDADAASVLDALILPTGAKE